MNTLNRPQGVTRTRINKSQYKTKSAYEEALFESWVKVGKQVYDANKGAVDAVWQRDEALAQKAGYRIGKGSNRDKFADYFAAQAISHGSKNVAQAVVQVNRSAKFEDEHVRFRRNFLQGFAHDDPELFKTLRGMTGLMGGKRGAKGQFVGRMSLEEAANSSNFTWAGGQSYIWTDDTGKKWEVQGPEYDSKTGRTHGFRFREIGSSQWIESAIPVQRKHYITVADIKAGYKPKRKRK